MGRLGRALPGFAVGAVGVVAAREADVVEQVPGRAELGVGAELDLGGGGGDVDRRVEPVPWCVRGRRLDAAGRVIGRSPLTANDAA